MNRSKGHIIKLGCIFILMILSFSACDDGNTQGNSSTPSCHPTYVYDNLANKGQAIEVLDFESDYNGTSNAQTYAFTVSRTQSIAISQSKTDIQTVHIEANGSAIVGGSTINVDALGTAQVDAVYNSVQQFNSSIEKTVTTSIADEAKLTVPPMVWANGIYGVFVQIVSGHLYSDNCPHHDDFGNITTLSPYKHGWCTWTRGPNVFTGGGQGPCLIID